jgi:hypothetical protein
MTFTAPAAIEATDTDSRTLRGIALPYGVRGYTSAGPVTIDAGAVRVPENLRACKLFREHGRTDPIGFAIEATDSTEALRMGFQLARTPGGDQALLEAAEGLRDALSVELSNVTLEGGHVTAADLVAVAQVAVPAFSGALLTATLSDDDQAKVHDLAQQIVDTSAPTEEEEPPAEDAPADAPPTEGARAMSHAVEGSRPAGMVPARTTRANPDANRRLWASHVAEAMTGARDAAQVNAALADITPANSTTDVFPRPQWLGELWTPQATARPLIDAIGVQDLNGMTIDGWKWETEPQVAPYAGNKAEIPTSPAKVVPAQATAQRIAGGWDLDRIYVDFSTGFVEAFQAAAVRDYRRKSQGYFVNGHPAITGPPAVAAAEGFLADATDLGASPDLLTAIQSVVTFLTGNGANVSFLAMATDAYQDFFAVTSSEAPWWLSGQSSINLNGTSEVAGTTIVVEPSLPAGTVLGGDRDAVSLYETGPINVTAVNLPNGGIDLGLFGYWAQLVHDDDGLAKTTVPASTTGRAAASAKKTASSGSK